jgi:glyoxylase-like metal-dependent hydrolase (beta-lactamase superfamily II)
MSASGIVLPHSMRVFERDWLSSNNVLFLGRDASVLVDSSYTSHAELTLALVGRSLAGRPLDQLINTHLHSDHCGGNARLQQRWPCRTLIPEGEAARIRDWRVNELNATQIGQQLERFTFDGTLHAGDTLTLGDLTWHVLAAPGHDPHSIILYCPAEAILISADALWEHGFGVIFPELVGMQGFTDTLTTLESIKALEVRLVIPGHGAPFSDVAGALERSRARLDYLSADPERNARHSVKVLLKVLLLEHQVLTREELETGFATLPLVREINSRFLHLLPRELLDWVISELARLNVARIEDGRLVNIG